jgi:NADPH-dependent curcumin reductase CurA
MARINKFIRLARRPEGNLAEDIFELASEKTAEPGAGEFLIEVNYLAIDPALLSRMRDEDNYTAGIAPGELVWANGVGVVVESRNSQVAVGEVRVGPVGMQQYSLQSDPATTRIVDPALGEPRWHLGVLGTTGVTAKLALQTIGDLKAGETVLVSSGGSSVGSIAAQLAKNMGCRTVGIVSTDEKARRICEEWGYDAAFSYRNRSVDEMSASVAECCPNGVDVYFDNTGGDISESVIDHFNVFARQIVVGRISVAHLKDSRADIGRRDGNTILVKRVKKQGFVVHDHVAARPKAVAELHAAVENGDLVFREDILEGIERAPEAFFRMINGQSTGKQLIRVS